MLKLRSLALELTPRCNQQCVYCYNSWRSNPAGATAELPVAEICRLVDRVVAQAELGHLTLTGGEPFVRRDLFRVIDHINGRGLPVVLISNGGLIDERAAKMLSTREVRYVQVTFAGPDADLHDAHCGPHSFERAAGGVASLVAAGIAVGGSFLCTRRNFAMTEATLDWMYQHGVRSHFAFNRFNPSGCGAGHLAELLPTRTDVLSALKQAEQFAASHDLKIHCTMPIPQCMINERDYPRIRFGQCSAGTDRAEYAVDPQGRLKLCTLQQHTIGSVLEHSLEELIASESCALFRASIPLFCEPCPHRTGCLGGCGAAAEWVFGSPDQPDPFLAQHVMAEYSEWVARADRPAVSATAASPDSDSATSRPKVSAQINPWYDLIYHVLSYLPLPEADASTLHDETYVRSCDRWFAEHGPGEQSGRTLPTQAALLARLYANSKRGSLLHAWPLLHAGIDEFLGTARDDFQKLTWPSSQHQRLADAIVTGTEPALPDLFRTALWGELVNGYEVFHKANVAPRAAEYRASFTRQLTELLPDLPALSQPIWVLSHPLRRHGRLLWPSPATAVIVVGVADDELGVTESMPVIQGCHEYFVLKSQSVLAPAEDWSPAVGQAGYEVFQTLENTALTLGARFFADSHWEDAHQAWLRCLFPGTPPTETASRLAAGETLPQAVAAAIANLVR